MADIILIGELTLKDNETAYFYDRTGDNGQNGYSQNGNIAYSSVKSIRIKTATYSTLSNVGQPTNNVFVQYVEYQKVGGIPEIINGKTFSVGDLFVSQFIGITTADATNWNTTGYYIYPFLNGSWLPTAAQVPLEISVLQLNQSGDNLQDNEYVYEYKIYNNDYSTMTAAVNATSYIVTISGYVTYNGNTYYEGEVFMASTTGNIVPSGGAHFSTLYAATSGYSTMVYSIESGLNDLIEEQIGTGNQDLTDTLYGNIIKISTKLQSLQYSSKTNNVSLLYCYQTIQQLQTEISYLLNT